MKAVSYTTQGTAADVLRYGEIRRPRPSPGEVLVRVYASGCNPSDVKLRAGARPMGHERIIPHSDGAGIIEAVGKGVDTSRTGQRVWIWNGQWQRANGTCAEYIAIPEDQAVWLPENVSFEEGACLGIPAMTAHRCVFGDGPVEGKTVLVTGGAGTVARYAIQMARNGGADVIATVSGASKAAYASEAGAGLTVNYRSEDAAKHILDHCGGVDRIVDLEFGANLKMTEQVIRPNGVIAAYGSAQCMAPVLPFFPLMFKDITLRMILVYLTENTVRHRMVNDLTRMLESGLLTHSVAALFDMADTAAAQRKSKRVTRWDQSLSLSPSSLAGTCSRLPCTSGTPYGNPPAVVLSGG